MKKRLLLLGSALLLTLLLVCARAWMLTDGLYVRTPNASKNALEPLLTLEPSYLSEQDSDRLDLNQADAKALQTLPGIGEVLAARILEYREQNGDFASVEELMAVDGLGPAALSRLRPYVTVGENK